jgi:hypothetical protein
VNTYTEFFEKAQAEFVNGLKQAQELNIKSLTTLTNLFAQMPAVDADETNKVTFPTPTELVERSFAFTNELLATRKEYAIKLAEIATEAQKQFADTAKRVAEAAKN